MIKLLGKNKNHTLEKYIKVYDNILDHNLCDRVINEYCSTDEWLTSVVGAEGKIDTSHRNVKEIHISSPPIVNENYESRHSIDKDLFACASKGIELYNKEFPYCNVEEDQGYKLLKYDKGYFFKEHVDSFKAFPRAVTAIFALNENYDGGHICFFKRNIKLKLKKGSILLFPSNFMYPHEITEIKSGTRYSIVTWFI